MSKIKTNNWKKSLLCLMTAACLLAGTKEAPAAGTTFLESTIQTEPQILTDGSVFMQEETATESSSQNMVAYAKKHKISRGKWVKNSKGIRYRKKNGTYVKNTWCYIDGGVYCFDKNGYVRTGAFKYKNNSYYADKKGKVYVKKWRKAGSKTFYYGANGLAVKSCWKCIGGKKYYFDRQCRLVTSSWVGSSYVGKNGAQVVNTTVKGRKINKSGVITQLSEKDKYIIVGASRIVDMSVAVNSSNTVFIAKGGQGYRWLKSTGGPRLTSYLKKNPGCTVIFQLGNNDCHNVNHYIQYYRKLIKKYPKTQFYFLDATPGDGYSAARNVLRQEFNEKMKEAFGSRCIGGYDYLVRIGFSTVDGVHYTPEISRKLYNYAISKVKKASASAPEPGKLSQSSTDGN